MLKTKKSNSKTYKIGALLLFVTLLVTGFYLFIKTKVTPSNQLKTLPIDTEANVVNTETKNWQTYTNEEFGYFIKHPPLLHKRELGPAGGYVSFTRFEENKFSTGKGLAVGVRESVLDEEVRKIKDEFTKQGGTKLVDQKEITLNGIKGATLYYKPVDPEGGEERVIAVLSKGKYSYSISTVPEQINEVLAGFGFID